MRYGRLVLTLTVQTNDNMTRLESDFSRFMAGLESAEKLILAAYGATGGNVLLCGGEDLRVFDDGFKALQIFVPSDPVECEAVRYLFGAAQSARVMVGDGTSTTVLLTVALIRAGRALREQGHSARAVVAAIRDAAVAILEHMKEHAATPNESDVVAAVTLAMHGDKASGEQIGSFMHKAGKNAAIVAQQVFGGESISLEHKQGLVWNAGVMSKAMLGDAARKTLNNVAVIMSAVPQSDMQGVAWRRINHALNAAGAKSVLLICPEASGSVLATFTREASMGRDWSIVGVPDKMNAWGFLNDLAAVIGGKVIDDLKGNIAENEEGGFNEEWLGVIGSFHATERNSCADIDEAMVDFLDLHRTKLELLLASSDFASDDRAKDALKNRLQFLSGFYGSINIPYISESQFSATKESVEDGYLAGKAALEGVLPGGGKALVAAVNDLLVDKGHQLCVEVAAAFRYTWDAQVKSVPVGKKSIDVYWNTVDTRTGEVVDAREVGILDSYAVLEAVVKIAVEVSIPVIEANMLIVAEAEVAQPVKL